MPPRVVSVRVGRPRVIDDGDPWVTAFHKSPVEGPIRLGALNLEGDEQADRRVHGGPDKAVCVYPADHLAGWRSELDDAEVGPGAFGENLTVAEQTEDTVCVGDLYRIGSALVQVSQPRGPCWKLARRWGRPDLVRRVVASGRTGWYLRVLEPGELAASELLPLLARPHPEWTIARVNALAYAPAAERDRSAARELASCAALAEGWRTFFAG